MDALMHLFLENYHEGIIIINKDGKVVYVNDAFNKIIGTPKEKILNRYIGKIEPDAPMLKVLATGKPVFEANCLSSVNLEVVGSSFPLFNEQQVLEGAYAVFTDIKGGERYKKMLEDKLSRMKKLVEYFKSKYEPDVKGIIIGSHPLIQDCTELVEKVAPTNATVLLLGESGVGKELFAQMIHEKSARSSYPIVNVNCTAIPENLLEAELFGYIEGAFTGAAKKGKAGLFEVADKGTLFLDEIGDMKAEMQAKLLRVLQDKKIRRLGSNVDIQVDVRIIAATNQEIEERIKKGLFREDLYYRLNTFTLKIPKLRERKSDIKLLVEHFLQNFSNKYNKKLTISVDALDALENHSWPGNVRELISAIEYAVIVCNENRILPKDLPEKITLNTSSFNESNETSLSYSKNVSKLERSIILKALEEAKGNKSRAIELLGISRTAFYKKLQRFNL